MAHGLWLVEDTLSFAPLLTHTRAMMDASREAEILARISKIPIFETLQMGSVVFGDGAC